MARIGRGDFALPEQVRAALDRDQRRHRLDQCRFARAVGAEDRGDAAGAEDRADIVEDRAGSERHPEAIDGQVHANLRCRSSSARKKGAPISAIATPSRTSPGPGARRSEEHTSELQSLMRTSYALFSLKKNI